MLSSHVKIQFGTQNVLGQAKKRKKKKRGTIVFEIPNLLLEDAQNIMRFFFKKIGL